MTQTIQNNWLNELKKALQETIHVRIVSPFITDNLVRLFLELYYGNQLQVITRFNLNDFRSGVSSISALEKLLNAGAEIKGIRGLHSKLYLFDQKSVIITSTNFTNGGFFQNKEFGIKSHDEETISSSVNYFNELWNIDDYLLTKEKLYEWEQMCVKSNERISGLEVLPDLGKSYLEKIVGNRNYFIKFFGVTWDRASWDYHARTEISHSHCHYALSFSRPADDRRPRKYKDGDIVFMAVMMEGRDYAIFGRAICYAHDDVRDIATEEDIAQVGWREDWPVLIRVHSPEFIDASMINCPKMSDLIHELDANSFYQTKLRSESGEININPWESLKRKADIQISIDGALWLEEHFKDAIKSHGKVPNSYISQFYQGIEIK